MQRILVGIDFSDFTPALVEQARRLAAGLAAEVFLVHVAEPEPDFVGYDVGPQTVRDSVAHHLRQGHRDLQALADRLRADGVATTALLVDGAAADTLLSEAHRLGVELLVLGTHGHGRLHRLLLGSVGESVLRRAPCAVLFVPLAGTAPGRATA